MRPVWSIALISLIALATGCNPSSEGDFEVLVVDHWESSTDHYGHADFSTPGPGVHVARLTIERDPNGGRWECVTEFEGRGLSFIEGFDSFGCENLAGGRIHCAGNMSGSYKNGPLRYEAVIRGSEIDSLVITELGPGDRERIEAEVRTGGSPRGDWPRVIGRFRRTR